MTVTSIRMSTHTNIRTITNKRNSPPRIDGESVFEGG